MQGKQLNYYIKTKFNNFLLMLQKYGTSHQDLKKNNQMIYIQEISKQKSSQACIKKSPLGQRKSSLFRQVTS